ncbi:hypothetical protein [Photobacterium leiognathi]|nr:hypothetical protein [Photobacterium leiognathi]
MAQNKIIGIDLAKGIFFLFEINHKGKNFFLCCPHVMPLTGIFRPR